MNCLPATPGPAMCGNFESLERRDPLYRSKPSRPGIMPEPTRGNTEQLVGWPRSGDASQRPPVESAPLALLEVAVRSGRHQRGGVSRGRHENRVFGTCGVIDDSRRRFDLEERPYGSHRNRAHSQGCSWKPTGTVRGVRASLCELPSRPCRKSSAEYRRAMHNYWTPRRFGTPRLSERKRRDAASENTLQARKLLPVGIEEAQVEMIERRLFELHAAFLAFGSVLREAFGAFDSCAGPEEAAPPCRKRTPATHICRNGLASIGKGNPRRRAPSRRIVWRDITRMQIRERPTYGRRVVARASVCRGYSRELRTCGGMCLEHDTELRITAASSKFRAAHWDSDAKVEVCDGDRHQPSRT